MPLAAGARLGPYEILGPLGAGGMGEVYKARDTRLDRIVAIKVLPPHFADRPELRDRFEREARTIANLKHPHICVLYDIGHENGTHYLVMEYLEGETLAQRLEKGPLPLDQVLQYAIEIADALDTAHRQHFTHRDIKPANIMLTKDGTKLLDFGLAKLKQEIDPALPPDERPTNMSLTAEGTILGTLQYMAPEQVEGRTDDIDGRTDVFAFGALVYEMATGKKCFEGKSRASVMAAILEREVPPMSALQPMTPASLDRVVKKCLAKEREKRWQTASDLHDELEWIKQGGGQAGTPAPLEAKAAAKAWRRALPWTAAVLAGALIASLVVWNLKPTPSPAPELVSRFVMTLPPREERYDAYSASPIALSPDGTQLVYSATVGGRQQLYLRSLDSLEAKAIRGTEGGDSPFFSPDGLWLGFEALYPSGWALKKVPLNGGEPMTLCECVPNLRGVSWGWNNTIVFAPSTTSAIWQVSASGGTPQVLTTLDSGKGEESHRWPELLPGGKAVLFTVGPEGGRADAEIVVQRLDTGERRVLVQGGTYAHYLPTGHLVYLRQGTLMAVPFDLARLEVNGAAVPVLEGISQNPSSGAPRLSISSLGSLAYLPASFGESLDSATLVWMDRKGAVQPLKAPPRPYLFARLSPDGRRVTVRISAANSNVWVFDNSGESLTRLTFEGSNTLPVWAADGNRIAYSSNRAGPRNLFWKAADGSGVEERLTTSRHSQNVTSWSPGSKLLAFTELDPDSGGGDIWVLPLEGDRKPQPYLKTPFFEGGATFSSDGRWLAYTSNESGRYEVYVQPFPVAGAKWQVSSGGGQQPVWTRNGRELFYLDNAQEKMMAADVSTQPTFSTSNPRELFKLQRVTGIAPPSSAIYDVSPDGQRFLMVQQNEPPQEPTPIHVVLNWFEELKRKVPVGK
ncbi:MAG: serine/threonine-protein kinase [Acidobacteria bacterium]|nr:serine/threonine-protein kinase [Acidobacteriota bacterium]